MQHTDEIVRLQNDWDENQRWRGTTRPYGPRDVLRLRGTMQIEHTLARRGSERLWRLLHEEPFVRALGALSGNQAVEMVQAGLKAIYVSGWQVAADANLAGQMYPDQSLYPANSVPALVKSINGALRRADQIWHLQGKSGIDWFAPIFADAEAGFGGTLNVFEIVNAMIEAGAAAVHLEDQQSSLKKCGHMGGKVLVPVQEFIAKLVAARLAADVSGVPTILVARTDSDGAHLLTSDIDPVDRQFLTGRRTTEGFFEVNGGVDYAIARGQAYAPYADMIWCETSTPDLKDARRFAEGIHSKFPGKQLAYNCSPSFNWKSRLDEKTLAGFQEDLGGMGYTFQFVTLAGFHALNAGMFDLASAYAREGMRAYARLQEREIEMERQQGYGAVKHQQFVGAGYFDEVQMAVSGGDASTTALKGSTEEEQFK